MTCISKNQGWPQSDWPYVDWFHSDWPHSDWPHSILQNLSQSYWHFDPCALLWSSINRNKRLPFKNTCKQFLPLKIRANNLQIVTYLKKCVIHQWTSETPLYRVFSPQGRGVRSEGTLCPGERLIRGVGAFSSTTITGITLIAEKELCSCAANLPAFAGIFNFAYYIF